MTSATPTPLRLRSILWMVGGLLLFVLVARYSVNMADNATTYDQKQATARYATLAKLRATEQQTLTTADWVDQTKGTVRIPIDEAAQEEIATLQAKPAAMGNDFTVAPPAAAASAPGQTPTTNAPAASSPGKAPATNAPAAAPAKAASVPASPPDNSGEKRDTSSTQPAAIPAGSSTSSPAKSSKTPGGGPHQP